MMYYQLQRTNPCAMVLQAVRMLRSLLCTLVAASLATTSTSVRGQTSHTSSVPVRINGKVAAVPFGLHEKATFKASFGGIGVGGGTAEVVGLDTIRGVPSYHFLFTMKGGIIFAHVDDRQESWMDAAKLVSMRFHQDLHEVNYKRDLVFDMYPAETLWRSVNRLRKTSDPKHEESGPLATTIPLDDISFMYWARTIPLEVGKTYTFTRYFKQDGNPVIVRVLRRETVKVPAGTYQTIVIQPVIRAKGMFAEGGKAELYFTDDARRMLVKLSTKLSIGSITLQLEDYKPGVPVMGTGE
jgi:hypothetical protein